MQKPPTPIFRLRASGALDDLSHLANASLMISCSADILSESFRIVALLYVLGEATRQRANGVETQTVRDLWGKIWVSRFWLWRPSEAAAAVSIFGFPPCLTCFVLHTVAPQQPRNPFNTRPDTRHSRERAHSTHALCTVCKQEATALRTTARRPGFSNREPCGMSTD